MVLTIETALVRGNESINTTKCYVIARFPETEYGKGRWKKGCSAVFYGIYADCPGETGLYPTAREG
jgi:hypothetical protein